MRCFNCQKFYGDYFPGDHLFPFRTESLSPGEPMVLLHCGRVGRRRDFISRKPGSPPGFRVLKKSMGPIGPIGLMGLMGQIGPIRQSPVPCPQSSALFSVLSAECSGLSIFFLLSPQSSALTSLFPVPTIPPHCSLLIAHCSSLVAHRSSLFLPPQPPAPTFHFPAPSAFAPFMKM